MTFRKIDPEIAPRLNFDIDAPAHGRNDTRIIISSGHQLTAGEIAMRANLKLANRLVFIALLVCLFSFLPRNGALAQGVPSAAMQEVMIKTTLSALNDANITGNYTVFHDLLAKPFRDSYSPDKLKETFKNFVEKKIYIGIVVTKPPIPSTPTVLRQDGVLKLVGYFDVPPHKLKYDLAFVMSEGDWKPLGINVDVTD